MDMDAVTQAVTGNRPGYVAINYAHHTSVGPVLVLYVFYPLAF